MDIRFENRSPIRVAFVRHVGPYEKCGKAWEQLCAAAGPQGLFSHDTCRIGVGYDDPDTTPAEKLRYDACITISDDSQPASPLGVAEIAGGAYAVATHRGPYSDMLDFYRAIFRDWLPASGRQLRQAPCFEVYVSDPATTRPEDLVTEIYVPLVE